MKKNYLLAFSLFFVLSGFAQNHPFQMKKEKMRVEQIPSKSKKPPTNQIVKPLPVMPIPERDVNIVSIVDLGTAPNALGYWQKLSCLWVVPGLNTVTNMPGQGNLSLAYDISKDGGQTWDTMMRVTTSPYSGRWTNHGIFNPSGNTDDAYLAYFSSSYVDENTGWGYLHGVGSIGDTAYHTASVLPSDERFHQVSVQGFDITSDGKVFAVGANQDWTSDTFDYYDSLIISRGSWDEDFEDFVYVRESLEALIDSTLGEPVDIKIAFGQDGQTGYIVMIGNNGEAEEVEGFKNLYPIYWKTTDGGENWDGPNVIQLDGPTGMNGIVNHHLTDEQIAGLFGDVPPPRTEISYTTAFDCDIAVDAWGKLHIAVMVGPTGADPFSIITAEGYLGAYDLLDENPYNPFCAIEMGRPRTFRGTFGDMSQDNRIQITTSPTADKIFISWLDTDLEDQVENTSPNIWVRGFDPITYIRTWGSPVENGPINVTLFSEGMWQAYLGTAPKYAFESDGDYTIPYVYLDMDPTDPLMPVQFKYIQDFTIGYYDWPSEWDPYLFCGWVGIEEQSSLQQPLFVSGNVPNPFREETTIQLELYKSENVSVTVYSITGRQLFVKDFGRLEEGSQQLVLRLKDFSPGVYFYTVTAGQNRVTKKMVVE
ncbi:MAG: T9SS type A sorting domain-containing protein [Bacteroidales bacterium]|nr:T9SS type A sorting domain-containing protein [Bacteroidales bacterium]